MSPSRIPDADSPLPTTALDGSTLDPEGILEVGPGGVVELARRIYVEQRSGVLLIEEEKSRHRLYFFRGELYLKSRPLASKLLRGARAQHERSQLVKAIGGHLAAWRPRTVRFVDGVQPRVDDVLGPLPTSEILAAAVLEDASDAQLLDRLGGLEARLVACSAPDFEHVRETLSSEEQRLLSRLVWPTRVDQVLAHLSHDQLSPLEKLARLWAMGLLGSAQDAGTVAGTARSEDEDVQSDDPAAHIWKVHFGLTGDPFSLAPDPALLYMSQCHSEALAALQMGILERRGLTVMIGEVGTGKTTLIYALLPQSHESKIEAAYIYNTSLSFEELLEAALKDLGLQPRGRRRLDLLETLNSFLGICASTGRIVVLVIDEAQSLSNQSIENLRLLLNFETYTRKLLQIVLVGQPELADRLDQPSLRQIRDRVAVRCTLNPLRPREARDYIRHRVEAVGGSMDLFTKRAVELVIRRSVGVPRRINVLCHNAMLFAYGEGLARIDQSVVRLASQEAKGSGLERIMRPAFLSGRVGRWLRSKAARLVVGTALALVATAGILLSFRYGRDRPESTEGEATVSAPVELSEPAPARAPTADEAPVAATDSATEPIEAAVEATEPAATPEAATEPLGEALTTVRINLRAGPGSDSRVLTTLPERSRLVISGEEADWLRVQSESGAGWVKSDRVVRFRKGGAGDQPTLVEVTSGLSLTSVVETLYGRSDPALFRAIGEANPELLDLDFIVPGEVIVVPDLEEPVGAREDSG